MRTQTHAQASPPISDESMNFGAQADFWDSKAAAAEMQVRNVKDPLAMDSWLMIADTCRQLAGQYRAMASERPTRRV